MKKILPDILDQIKTNQSFNNSDNEKSDTQSEKCISESERKSEFFKSSFTFNQNFSSIFNVPDKVYKI